MSAINIGNLFTIIVLTPDLGTKILQFLQNSGKTTNFAMFFKVKKVK